MTEILQAVSELVAELSPGERATLSSLLALRPEPIAVVGIGCRFPGGAVDPASFWRLLSERRDAVGEIPGDRWDVDALYDPDPDAPGKMSTRYGAFLDRVDAFDPHFFEISPREAARMDPQQRLLLEVAWEAMEDAGQPPDARRRSRTGVFIGGCGHDYEQLQTRGASLAEVDPHTLTGDLTSILAGRISYALGLEGPCMMVDTACSSSLVAIHLACESLLRAQCDLALAGGVNLILSPDGYVKLSKMRALSPDGRCRTFDARANGYARGEGAGVLALKRLSDARAAGDRVWAVLRGSAVNHDGRSAGLTAPNGLAQRDVIRAALDAAGVSPAEVGYIEAHGTGTPLGDPIEMEALKEVFGPRPDGSVCAVGSVKTNLGHLEGAAGVAGVIKTILTLWHGTIPAHLHWTQLNPRIALHGTPFVIPAAPRPWSRGEAARVAGVSSFGVSGTNAHVVLAEAPEPEPRSSAAPRTHHVIALSAKAQVPLGQLARRFATALDAEPSIALADVACSANTGRAHHPFRLAVVATSTQEAAARLEAFAGGAAPAGVVTGEGAARPKVAFLFTGQASERPGVARGLYETEPVFRQTLDRCDELLRPLLGGSLIHALFPPAGAASPPGASAVARPALFALEVAIAALWRAWGVEPDLVLGHAVGELAAACVAGVLSLEQGIELAASRGRTPVQARPPARIGIVLASTGRLMRPEEASDPERWSHPPRDPADLRAAMQALCAEGCDAFIEIGPGKAWLQLGRTCSPDPRVAWLPSLPGEERDGTAPLLEGLAALYARGAPIRWAAFHEHRPGRRISLPTYPFLRDAHWLPIRPKPPGPGDARRIRASAAGTADPLLGERIASPLASIQLEAVVGAASLALPKQAAPDELLDVGRGSAFAAPFMVPPALHLARLLAASKLALGGDSVTLEALTFPEPMILRRRDDERVSHLVLTKETGDAASFSATLASIPAESAPDRALWAQHVIGKLREGDPAPGGPKAAPRDPGGIAWAPDAMDRDGFYARLTAHGYRPLAGALRVERAVVEPGEATAAIEIPPAPSGASKTPLAFALLHAALEVAVAAALPEEPDEGGLPVPSALFRLRYFGARPGDGPWTCTARAFAGAPGDPITVDLRLLDGAGRPVAEAVGLKLEWRPRQAVFGELLEHQGDMLYQIAWRPRPLAAEPPEPPPGRWIVLADRTGLGEELAARLTQKHQVPILVRSEGEPRDDGRGDPLDPVLRLLDEGEARAGEPRLVGIVDLRAVDVGGDGDVQAASPAEDEQRRLSGGALSLVRALIDRRGRAGGRLIPRLWIVTRGAQAQGAGEDAPGLAGAPLWGLGRVLGSEHPDLWGGLVDLDPSRPAAEASMLADHLTEAEVEPEAAFRDVARSVPRLARLTGLSGPSEPIALRTAATYLITGGVGALGLAWARWMVRRGARHLVLVGRRPPGAETREALAALRAEGARVHVVQADISIAAEVDAIFRRIDDGMPPLAGIAHAAGVTEDAVLSNIDWESFARVLSPKVQGSTNLGASARGRALDFFVLFSSVAGLLGNPGQASYAAANAFQDALAQHLRARGVPALSVAWGPFAGVGMARDFVAGSKKHRGIAGVTLDDALAVFERLLPWSGAHAVAMSFDPSQLADRPPHEGHPALLADWVTTGARPAEADAPDGGNELLQRLARSSPERRLELLIAQVDAVTRSIMDFDPAFSLSPDQRLDELGLDSLLAIDLAQALGHALGTTLPTTLALDCPTVSAIAHYLEQELGRSLYNSNGC